MLYLLVGGNGCNEREIHHEVTQWSANEIGFYYGKRYQNVT